MMFIFFCFVALALAIAHYYKLRKELNKVYVELSDALAGEWGARLELNYVRQELLESEAEHYKLVQELRDSEADHYRLVHELNRVHNVTHHWLDVQNKLAIRTTEIFIAEGLSGSFEELRNRAFQEHVSELLAPLSSRPTPSDWEDGQCESCHKHTRIQIGTGQCESCMFDAAEEE